VQQAPQLHPQTKPQSQSQQNKKETKTSIFKKGFLLSPKEKPADLQTETQTNRKTTNTGPMKEIVERDIVSMDIDNNVAQPNSPIASDSPKKVSRFKQQRLKEQKSTDQP